MSLLTAMSGTLPSSGMPCVGQSLSKHLDPLAPLQISHAPYVEQLGSYQNTLPGQASSKLT